MENISSQSASSRSSSEQDKQQPKSSSNHSPGKTSAAKSNPSLQMRVLVASGEQANANLACLQLLYACKQLRKHFISNAFEVDKIHLTLGELFGRMAIDEQQGPLDATSYNQNLLDAVWPHVPTAPDFLVALLYTTNSQLAAKVDSTQKPTLLDKIIASELFSQKVCFSCIQTTVEQLGSRWMVTLELDSYEDGTTLAHYISVLFGDKPVNEFCNKCQAFCKSSKWINFSRAGPALLIHLKRVRKDGTKAENFIEVNHDIDFCEKPYQLTAALLHRGSSSATGYWTMVRQDANTWTEVDEKRVNLEQDQTTMFKLGKYCQVLLYTQQDENDAGWPRIVPSLQDELPLTAVPMQSYRYCGLVNLGLSCYANSCLQLFYTLPRICQYLVSSPHYGPFHKSLSKLFAQMKAEAARIENPYQPFACLKPEQFMGQFRAVKTDFRYFQMADAQEFLTILLELVHQEANKAIKIKQDSEHKTADEAWQWHVAHVDNSFLSSQLMGQVESALCCCVCSHRSLSWSCIWQLQLPLGQTQKQSEAKDISLKDCITEFLAEETLSEDCRLFCGMCDSHKPATKRTTICRTPLLMLVHLTRFAADGTKNQRRVTIDEHINLSSHPFELTSAVLHRGSEHGGHYFTLHQQDDGQWVKLDDDHVNKQLSLTAATDLLCDYAYLCVYKAVEQPGDSNKAHK